MLTGALIAAALAAGLAGAWSPCGFSMVETIAPSAYGGRVRATVAGALAYALGALAGGVATFGGLALAGRELGFGGGLATTAAAALLLAGAAGDAAGRRIVPQVRRQVPESWRRVMPLTLASFLYGILLGLGFTTFVLSFASWSLALACLAFGSPALGVAVGLAFAAGRTLPVIAIAPLVDGDRGLAVATAMAERPAILRSLRGAAATALAAAAALVALGGAPAQAAPEIFQPAGTDPSAADGAIAWQVPGGGAFVQRGADVRRLPGTDPAIGGGRIAWRIQDRIEIAPLATLETERSFAAPGAEELALSAGTLAWRDRLPDGRQRILAADTAGEGPTRVLSEAISTTWAFGRPSLDGSRLAFDLTTPRSSRIVVLDLSTGLREDLITAPGAQVLQPTLSGDSVLYVRATARRQQLLLSSLTTHIRQELWSTEPTARRDAGHERGHKRHRAGYPDGVPPPLWTRPAPGITATLWSTTLAPDAAYVTRLLHYPASVTRASIVRVPFPVA